MIAISEQSGSLVLSIKMKKVEKARDASRQEEHKNGQASRCLHKNREVVELRAGRKGYGMEPRYASSSLD